jgi:hypothetical protein
VRGFGPCPSQPSYFSPLTSHPSVCYFLYLASPLTLSEVRAMLPDRATADLADFPDQQKLKSLHPGVQTVARLLIGRCSCDFVRPRLADEREDERHLRERYRRLGVSRDAVIKALERHRRGAGLRPPTRGWPRVLADFIAEHARNAGPTLYYLQFAPEAAPLPSLEGVRELTVGQVMAEPEGWLLEGSPALVSR